MAKGKKIRWDRIAWKRVIPAGILLFLALYFVISLIVGLFSRPSTSDIYTICNLSGKQTLKAIGKEDRSNAVVVKDYNFYGENLNLWTEAYDRNSLDTISFAGDSYVLVDLCSNRTHEFEISSAVDGQIDLSKLESGFYAVYVKQGDKASRVYVDHTILNKNVIYTVTRNATRTRVELIANRKQFDSVKSKESVLDQPYLYLKVTEEAASSVDGAEDNYDVVISIAPALTMDKISLVGEKQYGITEAKELWDVAQELKTKLQEQGLKVRILKDAYDAPYNNGGAFYGTDGVLNRAYDSGARYFIYLDMGTWDGETGTYHSSFAAGSLAESIHNELVNIGLMKSSQFKASNTDKANGSFYDEDYEIREAGGIVLGAGTYSDASAANMDFAGENIYGINTVKIVTNNVRSQSGVNTWKAKKDQIAQAICDGIMKYFKGE